LAELPVNCPVPPLTDTVLFESRTRQMRVREGRVTERASSTTKAPDELVARAQNRASRSPKAVPAPLQ